MCPKIDVMERECKKLEVGRDLNKALVVDRDRDMFQCFNAAYSCCWLKVATTHGAGPGGGKEDLVGRALLPQPPWLGAAAASAAAASVRRRLPRAGQGRQHAGQGARTQVLALTLTAFVLLSLGLGFLSFLVSR
jgi:hypothetical protein